MADAIRNILLFTPLGIGLALVKLQPKPAILTAAFLSTSVELLQLFVPGRFSGAADVLSNTLGCVIGFGLVVTSGWWMFPSRRLASMLSVVWASVAGGSIFVTGYLLQPSYPETLYYGQWTPNLGHLEWYRGKVLDARVGSRFIRSWNLEHSDSVRADLLRGAPIEVLALAGPRVPHLASLFSISGGHQRRIILIGPDKDDLVYRYRMRAADARLEEPEVRIGGVMALAEGDSIRIKVWHNDQRFCIAANEYSACELWFTAGTGWRFLLPVEHVPSWMETGLDIVWIVMLLAPFGFWLRPTRNSAVGGTVIIAALIFSPSITGTLKIPLVEWIRGGIGLGIGALLGAWARRRCGSPHSP